MLVTIDGITYLVSRGTKEYDHLLMVITARRNGWQHWVKVEILIMNGGQNETNF